MSGAIAAIVETYGAMAGDIATDFYRAERRSQGVYGRFSPRIADLPPEPQVEKSVRWAAQDVLALPKQRAEPKEVESRPREQEKDDDREQIIEAARTKLEGVTDKMVLDVGRNTLIENIERDRQAKAWARIPEADCCAFCALLSTRGAVYKDEDSAGRDANDLFEGDGDFKFHDHCRCNIEPLFGDHYEMTAQVREWEALYKKATSEAPPGADKLNEFRRWYEGRQDAPRRSTN